MVIGGCSLRIDCPVGTGSFGVVWAATQLTQEGGADDANVGGGTEIVVKEQRGGTQFALSLVLHEGQLLAKLREAASCSFGCPEMFANVRSQ